MCFLPLVILVVWLEVALGVHDRERRERNVVDLVKRYQLLGIEAGLVIVCVCTGFGRRLTGSVSWWTCGFPRAPSLRSASDRLGNST